MRLEPVYLVAPEPRRPTRRGFVWIALAGAVGGVAGFALRQAFGEPGVAAATNARLAWARRLAAGDAPIGDLVEHYQAFLLTLEVDAPEDARLWSGVLRIAHAVLEQPTIEERARIARLLVATIARPGAPAPEELRRLVPSLERVR
jgi:hypothetical protein